MSVSPAKQFQKDELDVRIFDSIESMATDAAEEAKIILVSAIEEKGEARAIIATGNSQDVFLEKLTTLEGIDWSKVTLFHMDEYLGMSIEHTASFRKYLKERVADVVKPAALHLLEGDAMEPLKAVHSYSALLKDKPVDVCCLGIGENGHIAFNDPAVADFEDPEVLKIVKLDETCRQQQVGEGHFPNLDAVPMYAISIPFPLSAT